ncbi:MAG: L-2-hydroxyglutarate oxidase [Legionellaceae bacterium]|nr:L-2-hydroxyglutarate oxidase [Legionellaceae bacterium]
MRADFVIVGAGILGLTIARELRNQYANATIVVIEKEAQVGLHASGRNSGILHAGIYYKSDSMKAKFCLNGARAMAAYCDEHQLPINRIGKLIVPAKKEDVAVLNQLYDQALQNGAQVKLIKGDELRKMEPHAQVIGDTALFSPETAVVDPKAILKHMYTELVNQQVTFHFNRLCSKIDVSQKKLDIGPNTISYGHLFNTAGLYADQIAIACGLSDRYTMIPFKGMYFELSPKSSLKINHLIYPVPDMNVPFLGVHFTTSIHNTIYVGPTAIPVLGREHYSGLKGIRFAETLDTWRHLGRQYVTNKQGFRFYAHQEIPRFLKARFVASAKALVPELKTQDLIRSKKVGIRAQLFDKQNQTLAMDFIVEKTKNETHVLNAVSPAFTSSFSFSKHVVESLANA